MVIEMFSHGACRLFSLGREGASFHHLLWLDTDEDHTSHLLSEVGNKEGEGHAMGAEKDGIEPLFLDHTDLTSLHPHVNGIKDDHELGMVPGRFRAEIFRVEIAGYDEPFALRIHLGQEAGGVEGKAIVCHIRIPHGHEDIPRGAGVGRCGC